MILLIYLDNAATTYPKPEIVYKKMEHFMRNHANPGRSGHKMAINTARAIMNTRIKLSNIFNIDNPLNIIFTYNATDALNMAIKGVLKKGDHVITTSMEHNSVLRPLFKLKEQNYIDLTIISIGMNGEIEIDEVENTLRSETKMIVSTHVSNVTGTILPIEKLGKLAKKHNKYFLVDVAQSAGVLPVDVKRMKIDMLAFAGHKSLFGPQGVGGLYLGENINIHSLREGGTGSESESLRQPQVFPDKFESGTPNSLGIAGLGAGVEYILSKGIGEIGNKEKEILKILYQGLCAIDGVEIYGPDNLEHRSSMVSFNIKKRDSREISMILDKKYDIACRGGLHCAPLIHKSMGTIEQGAVRFSISYLNSEDDINRALCAIKNIVINGE